MTVRSFSLQVAQRGLITLPQAVRKAHDIRPGQEMTLVDLDGVFVLSPRPSQIGPLADELARQLGARGQSLESMLQALREVRAESA
jgi:bifunctional DNA-binding transcriptional regulator/antitoxin component of YhaV-PrlF toxin-antitoxin module